MNSTGLKIDSRKGWRAKRGWLALSLLPCLLLLALTFQHLEQGDFRRDTGRYAAVGLQMWESGALATPYLNPDTPYFNKPPLALLVHGFFLKTFGVNLTVARLPSILAALGVVWLSVLTVRQIGSRAEAVVSGLVLAATYEYFRRTREISLDLWQLLFLMLAAYVVIWAGKRKGGLGLVLAGVPLGLALLCKPLVGLCLVPVFAVWLWFLGWRRGVLWLMAGAVPMALVVAFPWHWHMYAVFGRSFINQYFFHEVVDRAQGLLAKEPPLYYLKIILKTYWPWLAVAAVAVYWRVRPGARVVRPVRRDLVLLGGIWCVYFLVLISCFPDKKPNYALPIYPMLSWVSAAGLCRLRWGWLRSWYGADFKGVAPVAVSLLLVCSIAPIRFQKGPDEDWISLLKWMEAPTHSRSVIRYHEALDPNDVCYFFLKRGYWPGRYNPAAPRMGMEAKGTLVLVPVQMCAALPKDGIVFQNGKFAVFRPMVVMASGIRAHEVKMLR